MEALLSKADSPEEGATPGTPRKFYEHHVNAWKESNLSQAEYCRKNDLIRHRFGYWKRKLINEAEPVEFVMLPANLPERVIPFSHDEQKSPLRLMVGSQVSLEIPNTFSPETLEKVLQVLQVM